MIRVHYYLHTHWDREWHKTQPEFHRELVPMVDDIIAQLEEGRLESFYFDGQYIPIEDYLSTKPGNRRHVRRLVKQEKMFFGPWYVLPDEFLVSGESLARNLLIGIEASREMGVTRFTGYLPDTFGHAQSIPMLLKSCGIDTAVVWRGLDPAKASFWWQSPDGSRVRTHHLTRGYYQPLFHDALADDERYRRVKAWLAEVAERSANGSILLPVGFDHSPLPGDFRKKLEEVAGRLPSYTFVASTPLDFLDQLPHRLPVRPGEFRGTGRNFILPNVTSTRLPIKRENAVCQWDLARFLEPIAALAFAHGRHDGRQAMKRLWKGLLQNHPHDSICGCSTDEVCRDVMKRFDRLRGAVRSELRKVVPAGNRPLVFNGTPRPWSGVVVDARGTGHFVKSAPPLSFVALAKVPPAYSIVKVRCKGDRISNGRLTITAMPDGSLSVSDHKLKRNFVGLHRIYDQADRGDEYNFDPLPNDKPLRASFDGFKVLSASDEVGEYELKYRLNIPASLHPIKDERAAHCFLTEFTTRLQVRAGSPLLRFRTTWDNRSADHRLQVVFSTSRVISEVEAEDHFGTVTRIPYSKKQLNRIARPGEELPVATAPMQRFVTDHRMTLFGLGLPEYELHERGIGLTILRSVGWLSRDVLGTRGGGAGPFIQTPEAQGIGPCRAEYGWAPYEDTSDTFAQADLFMDAVRICNGGRPPYPSSITVHNRAVQLVAVKIAEDRKGIVVRLLNPLDESVTTRITWGFRHTGAFETNLLENSSAKIGRRNIRFRPGEVKHIMARV